MTTRKKARLGRGLEALLGDVRPLSADAPATTSATGGAPGGRSQLRELPIEQLQRGKYQPRTRMDKPALEELAETIRVQGVIQPLLVREIKRGRYEIIAGERRWRGAQLAGLKSVPAVVREVSDQSAMAVALIENIQREDLNAIEEAAGLQRLVDDFGLTHQQIAEVVGRSRAAVSNLLRLLALNPAVKKLLEAGKIEMAHARTLLQLPAKDQPGAANQVAAGGLSVRRTELLVKRLLAGAGDDDRDRDRDSPKKDPDVQRLEGELSTRIGARVSIQHNTRKGKDGAKKGKLVIHYHSLDELDGIIERIK